ncbi:cytochrome P450 [Dacryopinax primogenitus]|uniref:Cytochrome P450 n=1 Tax=Dacryopinax primogenitus (strain DJM 731) TaxID=1858805 RepID=M5FYF3_DACPD|nr:cytochrome P450 [Dacryopinax primogenitus]EJU00880.1 cytochrome P450 [Dacryopinax primogenitus]
MDTTSLLILATPSIIVLLFLYITLQYLTIKEVVSLHELPGPPGGWYGPVGHLPQLLDPDVSPETHERYTRLYGPTFQTFGFGPLDRRLFSLSPPVVKYILDHPEKYQKGWQGRAYVDQAIGEGGLAMAEGTIHRVMRRLLQPVFRKKNLDALSPISSTKALELCHMLHAHSLSRPSAELDILPLLTRATFDVIGLAGFGHAFDCLSDPGRDPLYQAFQGLFSSISGFTLRMWMGIYFPWLDERFPDQRVKTIRESRALIDSTVKHWIRDRQAEIGGEKPNTPTVQEIISAAPKAPMVDELVIAQVNTFLMAGSETTALTIAWALYYLSQNAAVQFSLREECMSVNPDMPGAFVDGVDRLPLLEKVVRETLRLTPAVHSTFRQAMEDDIIPLPPTPSKGGETAGRRQGPIGISIRKGQYVRIPLEGLNTLQEVWGEDAHEWNPARWDALMFPPSGEKLREDGKGRTGWKTWAGLMSFSAGPKACIGMRFALIDLREWAKEMTGSRYSCSIWCGSLKSRVRNRSSSGMLCTVETLELCKCTAYPHGECHSRTASYTRPTSSPPTPTTYTFIHPPVPRSPPAPRTSAPLPKAKAPFSKHPAFDNPDADLILRTGDKVLFRVFRVILIESSDIFRDLFAIPHPPTPPITPSSSSSAHPMIPVLDIPEPARLLNDFLLCIYPLPHPRYTTLEELMPMFDLARKYTSQRVVDVLRGQLVNPDLMRKTVPLRVYALACKEDLEQEKRIAAAACLDIDIDKAALYMEALWPEELKDWSALDLTRLIRLRDTRFELAAELVRGLEGKGVCCVGSCRHDFQADYFPEFQEAALMELRKCPTSKVVFTEYLATSGMILAHLKRRLDMLPDNVLEISRNADC